MYYLNKIPAVISEKGEQVKCIVNNAEGLTEGKVYDIVYNGGNHSVVYDDNGKHTMISYMHNPDCFETLREYIAVRQDLDDLITLEIIEVSGETNFFVKWLDSGYDGVYNYVKELAQQRELKADVNGIYKVQGIAQYA